MQLGYAKTLDAVYTDWGKLQLVANKPTRNVCPGRKINYQNSQNVTEARPSDTPLDELFTVDGVPCLVVAK
jgi:hypothetical protein